MFWAFSAFLLAMALSAALAVAEWLSRRGRPRQTVRLLFGRDLAPDAVVAVVDSLAGLPADRTVTLETEAVGHRIEHYLTTDRGTLDHLRARLRALLPSLRLTEDKDHPARAFSYGRVLRLRGRLGVLRTDGIKETNASLLASLHPLGQSERLLLRWQIRPARAMAVPQTLSGKPIGAEVARLLRSKNAGNVVRARGLIAVQTGERKRAWHLQARLLSVLRTRLTPYGQLRSAVRSGWWLQRLVEGQTLTFGDRYGAQELAALLAWPVEAPALPGLSLGTSPLLMPSERLPQRGRVLGLATWPGAERSIAQPVRGALSHTLIAGPSGVGKSTLLANLVLGDISARRGCVLIDGKGDTAHAVLARLPADRLSEVIVLDCASPGPQPGFRAYGGGEPELAADVLLGVFSDLFRDSWGPLSERYLRAGLVAVANDPSGTLADVPYVFSDPAYRRRLVGQIRDPLTKATFAALEGMSAGEQAHQLAAPLNKLGALLSRPAVRTVLGQVEPKLDFWQVLRERKVVVISLAPARVGGPAARLIGALTVFGLFQAVQGRSAIPERARVPFFVYLDEPRTLGDLPMPLDALLEQARGLGVGVTLAPRSVTQLPKRVREAALTNVATRVVFRQHADDARVLAADLPGVRADELGDLAAFEAVARIGLGPGDVAPLVSLKTLPAARPVRSPIRVREASAERYGATLQAVDAALAARHQGGSTAPVGRRRRAP
jgi:energy-coupling factor transporter ATP-binding protein EcfA2